MARSERRWITSKFTHRPNEFVFDLHEKSANDLILIRAAILDWQSVSSKPFERTARPGA